MDEIKIRGLRSLLRRSIPNYVIGVVCGLV